MREYVNIGWIVSSEDTIHSSLVLNRLPHLRHSIHWYQHPDKALVDFEKHPFDLVIVPLHPSVEVDEITDKRLKEILEKKRELFNGRFSSYQIGLSLAQRIREIERSNNAAIYVIARYTPVEQSNHEMIKRAARDLHVTGYFPIRNYGERHLFLNVVERNFPSNLLSEFLKARGESYCGNPTKNK